ncbi:MAG: addiction module protein [Burkholderiaceae bacterium]|nr:addiction module protein [Burkholderiaceae bacterium]MBP6814068.1 addiction module protein [Burkholderiaceae bacterium]MBP7660937.1 addiction module protein [Burkholderiaceae bacterium]
MNSRIDQLIHEALELPAEQRSTMLFALLDSLEGCSDDLITEAWRAEVKQRRADLAAGLIEPISWAGAKARLLAL